MGNLTIGVHPYRNPDWRPGLALTYVFGILYMTVESGYTPYAQNHMSCRIYGDLRFGYSGSGFELSSRHSCSPTDQFTETTKTTRRPVWKRFQRRVLNAHRANRCWFIIWYLLFIITIVSIFTSPSRVNDFPGLAEYPVLYNHPRKGFVGPSQFVPVIIVGYMRSGSTLTADFIQQNSDVFYMFEPLHEIEGHYIESMEAEFPDLKLRGKRTTMVYKTKMLNILRAWFTCDLKLIMAKETRPFPPFFKYGKKTNLFKECLQGTSIIKQQYTKRCTSLLFKLCLESKYRLVKSIRISLKWLNELLEEFPTLKVIHLVRDPRAIIESQMKFPECDSQHDGVPGCSYNLCQNMEDDILSYEFLQKLFPERLHRLYFEDLAQNPVPVTKRLYEYLGLELDSVAEDYIINATSAGNKATGIMSTIRKNSTDSIFKWRRNLSERNLQTIQTMCKYVMEKLSYHHFIKP